MLSYQLYGIFLNKIKILDSNERSIDARACKIGNETHVSTRFLYEESKNWSTYFLIEKMKFKNII